MPPGPGRGPSNGRTLTIVALAVVGLVVVMGTALALVFSSDSSRSPSQADRAGDSSSVPDVTLPDYAQGDAEDDDEPPAAATTLAPPPSPAPPAVAGPIAFGQPWEWEDGMSATVVSAAQFEIGEYSFGAQPGQIGVTVTVTFTNNSAAAVDLTLAQVELRAGAAGLTASSVYDSSIGDQVSGTIAPGQSASGQWGFGINPGDLGALSVVVTPSWSYEDGLFTGAAG